MFRFRHYYVPLVSLVAGACQVQPGVVESLVVESLEGQRIVIGRQPEPGRYGRAASFGISFKRKAGESMFLGWQDIVQHPDMMQVTLYNEQGFKLSFLMSSQIMIQEMSSGEGAVARVFYEDGEIGAWIGNDNGRANVTVEKGGKVVVSDK